MPQKNTFLNNHFSSVNTIIRYELRYFSNTNKKGIEQSKYILQCTLYRYATLNLWQNPLVNFSFYLNDLFISQSFHLNSLFLKFYINQVLSLADIIISSMTMLLQTLGTLACSSSSSNCFLKWWRSVENKDKQENGIKGELTVIFMFTNQP